MRILLWHGYLLGGTGSNVYSRALAREWSRDGHDVTVLCQEPHPELYDTGSAAVVRPELGTRLPTFVLDEYEGLEAVLLQDMPWDERRRYVEANARAIRELAPADLLFANHLLLGGPVGAAAGLPFRVKAHGSELEYSMRGRPELIDWARECLTHAEAVYVGSEHIRAVVQELMGHVDRVAEVPPGVDVEEFRPRPRDEALAALLDEARRDPPNPGNRNDRIPDEGNAVRLEAFFSDDRPRVVFVGKLIRNKGVQILFEALRGVDACALIVGFGDYRAELEALAPPGTLFTGALEHRHLRHLLPLADVSVVPSIFPEAFGMVAAEAAAAGVPPLVARHSGLAEVAAGIEREYPPEHRDLAGFENGNAADLAAKLGRLLALAPAERTALGEDARNAVVSRWSWTAVARRLVGTVEG